MKHWARNKGSIGKPASRKINLSLTTVIGQLPIKCTGRMKTFRHARHKVLFYFLSWKALEDMLHQTVN